MPVHALRTELRADPGGSLPSWIVNWASERMPFDTIAGLRTQVTKPGYESDLHALRAALDWTPYEEEVSYASANARQ